MFYKKFQFSFFFFFFFLVGIFSGITFSREMSVNFPGKLLIHELLLSVMCEILFTYAACFESACPTTEQRPLKSSSPCC
jgi:hypothetical protein